MSILHTSAVQKDVVPRFIRQNSLLNESLITSSKDMMEFLLDLLDERKALDIKYFSLLSKYGYIVDYVICASHTSIRSIHALAKYIKIVVKKYSSFSIVIDSSQNQGWIVIDFGDIFVHLFLPQERQNYQIDDFYQSFTSH